MSIIKSIKQQLGLGPAAENHFFDGSVPNQLSLKRGTPEAPGAELIKALNGVLSFPNQGQSLTANGYVKLPGGLIVQWGTAAPTPDAGGNITVPFLENFPTACATVTIANGNLAAAPNNTIALGGFSTAGFTARAWDAASGLARTTVWQVNWIAIGY